MTDGTQTAALPQRPAAAPRGHIGAVLGRYGVAVLLAAMALALSFAFEPIAERGVYLFFFAAVVSSAWYGGLGPGLVTTVLTVAAADFYVIPPIGAFSPYHRREQVALGVFVVLSVVASTLSASLRDARRRAEAAAMAATGLARQLAERAGELEMQVAESRHLTEELAQTNRQLREAAAAADAARADAEVAEQRVTGILASIGDGFLAFDHSWRCQYINLAAEGLLRTFGREPAQLAGQVLWEALPGLAGTTLERDARRAAAEQVTVECEEFHPPLQRWFQVRLYPGGDGISAYVRDVTQRREAEQSQQTLLEAARLLSASLDLGSTLRDLTGLFVPRFADYCVVYLVGADGAQRQAACRHVDPTKQALLEELGERWHPDVSHSASGRALPTATSVLRAATSFRDAELLTDNPAILSIFRELSPVSYMAVPLVAQGKAIGTVMLVSSVSGRRYGASELAVVELLGARAALAVDNARHNAEAQGARDHEVRASQLETQLAQAKLDVLRAQLNPHFLFNTLNTIAMLVRREAGEEALRGIVGLGALLRQVLDGRGTPEVALSEEFTLAERYLEIEQLRFRDRLQVHLSMQPEARDARVPTMILQPLVENAIRHGVARKSGPGKVTMTARRTGDVVSIDIVDDGPGFAPGWDLARARGVGLANTRDRLRQMYGDGQRLEARNAPEGGALVELQLPYRRTADPSLNATRRSGREE